MNKLIKYLMIFSLLLSSISSFKLYAQQNLPNTLFIGPTQVVKDGKLCDTTSGTGWYYENGTLYFTSEKFFNSSSYAYSDSNTAEIYADGNLVVDTTNANQNIQYQEYSTNTKCIFYVSGTLKLIGDGVLQTRITNGGEGRAFGVIANTLDLSDFKGTFTTAGCYAAGNVNQLILPKSPFCRSAALTLAITQKIFPSVPVSCTVMLVLVSGIISPSRFYRAIRCPQNYGCRSGVRRVPHLPLSGSPDADAPLQGSHSTRRRC